MKKRIGLLLILLLSMMLFSPIGDIGVKEVSAGGYCDWVRFVADVTIPDGVPVDPGYVFRKTWRLKNIGTCTWTRSYKLVFVSGEQMGGLSGVNLPRDVAPGQTIDLTIGMTAPLAPGLYRGFWQLQNPAGGLFGIGSTATNPFFVEIEVVSKAAPVFDFVANAPAANWRTEATGPVVYPSPYGNPFGFVLPVERPILENGIPSPGFGLLMGPPAIVHEQIFGIFPFYEVKRGDRFQTMVGCEYGSNTCSVRFVLQYKDENQHIRSFWNIDKSYKSSFTRVNLSLNPLAGRRLQFILLVRPGNNPLGDHALWANPVIVNSSAPAPEIATVTPLPETPLPDLPTPVSTTLPYTGCDRATFISDVTVPDGTSFAPGQAFTKTWRLKNTGRCTWGTDYALVFSTGDQMGGPTVMNLPNPVAPNQTIDLSVNLTAPSSPGNYRGQWFLRNASGGLFGIGLQANRPFWLSIGVTGTLPPTSANGYDFAAHACEAQWTGGGTPIACPSSSPVNGEIGIVNNPRLENNTVDTRPALLTVPNNVFNGYIQGVFPPFAVQAGDHFKSIVNCEYLQRGCYVVFRVSYQIDNGPVQILWTFGERYEGAYYQADIDLSALAGQNVKFILAAYANGSPIGDRAMWVGPSIVRSGGSYPTPSPIPTLTASATAVPTLPPATFTFTPPPPTLTETFTPVPTFTASPLPPVNPGTLTYSNQRYGFQFNYPSTSVITNSQDNFAQINLPFTAGTNLFEKYLQVTVFDNLSSCGSPLANGNPMVTSENVTGMNGIQFLKQSGEQTAFGNTFEWIAYSTTKGTACISLGFVLHSTNPPNNPAPPPAYNRDLETAVVQDVISTFQVTTP